MTSLVDVTELLEDPEFVEEFIVIHRTPTYDHGNMTFVEATETLVGSIQGPSGEELVRYPELAQLSNVISIHTQGNLSPSPPGGYADQVLWRGELYTVKQLDEDFKNWGGGWVHAFAVMVPPHRAATPAPPAVPPSGGP